MGAGHGGDPLHVVARQRAVEHGQPSRRPWAAAVRRGGLEVGDRRTPAGEHADGAVDGDEARPRRVQPRQLEALEGTGGHHADAGVRLLHRGDAAAPDLPVLRALVERAVLVGQGLQPEVAVAALHVGRDRQPHARAAAGRVAQHAVLLLEADRVAAVGQSGDVLGVGLDLGLQRLAALVDHALDGGLRDARQPPLRVEQDAAAHQVALVGLRHEAAVVLHVQAREAAEAGGAARGQREAARPGQLAYGGARGPVGIERQRLGDDLERGGAGDRRGPGRARAAAGHGDHHREPDQPLQRAHAETRTARDARRERPPDRRSGPAAAGETACRGSSSNSSASRSVIAPPSCSTSTMVTARR